MDAGAWEVALTAYYLRSDGPLGQSPLSTLDPRAEELARAAGLPISDAEKAKTSFLRCFSGDSNVQERLGNGVRPAKAPNNTPGYFRYLVLTCLVPTETGGDSNNFEQGLGTLLGYPDRFTYVGGIATLWRSLQKWCDTQRSKGMPFRRLILPDPGIWNRIGHSLKIAFPTWRERNKILQFLKDQDSRELSRPWRVIELLRQPYQRAHLGDQVGAAYRDFVHRYNQGDRYLVNHRFWKLVQLVSRTDESLAANAASETVVLELTYGLDDIPPSIRLNIETSGTLSSYSTRMADLCQDLRTRSKHHLSVLTAVDAGFVVFQESGWGVWRACSGSLQADRKTLAAVRIEVGAKLFLQAFVSKPLELGWRIWDLSPTQASTLSKRARGAELESDSLQEVELIGAIRTGQLLLGRPFALPSIRTTQQATVRVHPVEEGSPGATAVKEDSHSWRLCSAQPLYGRYEVIISESGGEDLETSKEFVFDERAKPHGELASSAGAGFRPECEIAGSNRYKYNAPKESPHLQGQLDPRLVDLGEAIYASGKSSLAEQDLFFLMNRTLPTEGPNPWDVLRAFQEGGWIEPFISSRWRARKWCLRKPRLLKGSSSENAIVDGALPMALLDHLTHATATIGGSVNVHIGFSSWAPAHVVVKSNHIDQIARDLSWDVAVSEDPIFNPAPTCWQRDRRSTERRERRSQWDWSRAQFVTGISPTERTQLSAWAREDDWDLYQIQIDGQSVAMFESRVPAILEAFRLKGDALFRASGLMCCRTANEGYLPVDVARLIRHSTLIPSGPFKEQGRWTYAYAVNSSISTLLTALFGRAVQSDVDSEEEGELLGLDQSGSLRRVRRYPSTLLRR